MNWVLKLFGKLLSCPASARSRGKGAGRRSQLSIETLESRLVPTVTYHGGALLSHVEAQGVYLGSDWNSSASLRQQASDTDRFLSNIVNSDYLDMLRYAGYNVGRGRASAGYTDTRALDKTHNLTDDSIRKMLQADISAGRLATPDPNRLYVIFVEPNVEVQTSFGNSVSSFLGYHGAFAGQRADGVAAAIRYAVICYPGGTHGNASIGSSYSAFQDLTKVASHEISEAVTDPDVNYKTLGWYDDTYRNPDGSRGAEIGDIANATITTYRGYTVQAEADKNEKAMYPTEEVYSSDGQMTVIANADGRLETFAIGGDHALYHKWQVSPGGAWSGWYGLGGWVSQISVGRNLDGRLEVFAIGGDHAMYHIWQTAPNGGWSGWNDLGGWVSEISVGSNADGRLEVFAIGGDHALYHDFQVAPNGGWSGWNGLGGWVSQISVGRNLDGRLEVFAIGGDHALYHDFQTAPNGGWSGWNDLGGWVSEISVGSNADGRLEVFATGGDHALYHDWQTAPNGGWSGWYGLGGWVM